MSKKKQKLELTWIGKDDRPKLEPRILIEDPAMSYHAKERRDGDIFDNMLIQGDNLLALKALESEYLGIIKCICIDPPYNTGNAFEHYEDGLEHSLWLSLMRDRLQLLYRLLSDDGSLWIIIDDNEGHYLKVMCDEIFGRKNFVANVIWEKADSPRMDAKYFSSRHDHILVYAKDITQFELGRVLRNGGEVPDHYDKVTDDGRRYYLKPLRAMGADGHRAARPTMYFEITAPDGSEVFPKNKDGSDSRWRWGQERVTQDFDRLEFLETKNGWSIYFRIYAEGNTHQPPETIWRHDEVGSNRTSKSEVKKLPFTGAIFDTPKPERLIRRILDISTEPGDVVLDSFAGSGTAGAVAHKMNRRWIMVELGDHAETHIHPRIRAVVDGSDNGGISSEIEWKGGGGFRYYRLAPSLLEKDQYGNWVISKEYNASMLAEAMCKNLGFTYAPSQDEQEYWRHGHSTETDFIFVTTASMTHAALKKLSEDVGPERTLLVCCKAFNADADAFENLTIKKIPHAVLTKCEWGKDDYSLNVANLPMAKTDEEIEEERMRDELPLFGQGEEE